MPSCPLGIEDCGGDDEIRRPKKLLRTVYLVLRADGCSLLRSHPPRWGYVNSRRRFSPVYQIGSNIFLSHNSRVSRSFLWSSYTCPRGNCHQSRNFYNRRRRVYRRRHNPKGLAKLNMDNSFYLIGRV